MDLKDLQEGLKKRGVVIRYDSKGYAYVSVPVGNVPIKQFEEWQQRCDLEFGGNRWNAIWNDYIRSQNFNLQLEVETLKQSVQNNINNEPEEEMEEDNPLGLLNN